MIGNARNGSNLPFVTPARPFPPCWVMILPCGLSQWSRRNSLVDDSECCIALHNYREASTWLVAGDSRIEVALLGILVSWCLVCGDQVLEIHRQRQNLRPPRLAEPHWGHHEQLRFLMLHLLKTPACPLGAKEDSHTPEIGTSLDWTHLFPKFLGLLSSCRKGVAKATVMMQSISRVPQMYRMLWMIIGLSIQLLLSTKCWDRWSACMLWATGRWVASTWTWRSRDHSQRMPVRLISCGEWVPPLWLM